MGSHSQLCNGHPARYCLHSSLQHPLLFWLSPTAAADTVLMCFSPHCQPSMGLLHAPQLGLRLTEQRGTQARFPGTRGQRATQRACRQQGREVKLEAERAGMVLSPGAAVAIGRLGFAGLLLQGAAARS